MRLIGLAVVLAVCLALAPLVAEMQPATKVWSIGALHTSSPKDEPDLLAALAVGQR